MKEKYILLHEPSMNRRQSSGTYTCSRSSNNRAIHKLIVLGVGLKELFEEYAIIFPVRCDFEVIGT